MGGSEGAGGGDSWAVTSPLLTPALMVYYLCCWPGDAKSETSTEKTSREGRSTRAGTVSRHESVTRRASDLFHRKVAASVLSLHLPSTSGHKKEPLSAHRSHEEIRRVVRGGRTGPGGTAGGHDRDATCNTSRYHSAPSVIDEVLHRRDWERSTRDLHIPLRSPDGSGNASCASASASEQSPASTSAPRAQPDCSSLEDHHTDEQIVRPCKKHYTNIKSSKRKERDLDDKDSDATEQPDPGPSTFYIGDNDTNSRTALAALATLATRTAADDRLFKAKEAKQTLNESIRRSDRPRQTLVPLEENLPRVFGFSLDDVIDRLDRSGATHHTIESRISLSKPPHPPPSVEAVGYEGGACYLSAVTHVTSHVAGAGAGAAVTSRARHASDGDILAPAHACRPESGAFSESDLDLEVDVDPTEEVPPPYDELHHFASPKKKETAI